MDIISALPQDITERILTRLPIRDALRMSILSRKWRYCWVSIPMLLFDYEFFERLKVTNHKLSDLMLRILRLYTGPVVNLSVFIELEMVSEIDKIILYLSRSNKLKSFFLNNKITNVYKLPPSFFSLQGLEVLDIFNCIFEPPLTFNGFGKLRLVAMFNVQMNPEMLKLVLANCSLLQYLYLSETKQKHITRGDRFTFVELFERLPSIVFFSISKYYVEYFAAGGIPKKLPTPLAHLRVFSLDMCFIKQDEMLSIICLIKSSPNLKKIRLRSHDQVTTSNDFIDLQDDPDFKLDHLEKLKMSNFSNFAVEMEFVKLVMAKSPALKKVRIQLAEKFSVDEEVRMYRDLIRLPLPRAPSAELIIDRHKTSA